jgi:hypothetical protein
VELQGREHLQQLLPPRADVLRPRVHRSSGVALRAGLGGVGHQELDTAVDLAEQRVGTVERAVGDQSQRGRVAAAADLESRASRRDLPISLRASSVANAVE